MSRAQKVVTEKEILVAKEVVVHTIKVVARRKQVIARKKTRDQNNPAQSLEVVAANLGATLAFRTWSKSTSPKVQKLSQQIMVPC